MKFALSSYLPQFPLSKLMCYSSLFILRLQVWQDVRNEKSVHDGKRGPLGTFDK